MIPSPGVAPGAAAVSRNGTASRCEHLDGLAPVGPRSADGQACQACQACQTAQDRQGARESPADLAVCLSCGWVACGDDSPRQHARAHYEETDHPVAARLGSGAHRRWCYVHQRLV